MLAVIVFIIAINPACALAIKRADYIRRRNLWLGITVAVFLANDYWVYIIVVAMLLAYASLKDKSKVALFFFVLFAVPLIPNEIRGFGSANLLFAVDYAKLLGLVVLFPAIFSIRQEAERASFGRMATDKFLIGYLIIQYALILKVDSATNAFRVGIFYPFLGVFLPYFIASRTLNTLEKFREAMMSFVIATLLLSAIAVFEFLKHWLLYKQLEVSFEVDWSINKHLLRAGDLRATASTGQPIALGFAITVGIGFLLFFKPFIPNRGSWQLGMLLLLAGLMATLSRGPWVGAAVLLFVLLMTEANPVRKLAKAMVIVGVLLLLGLASPMGGKIMNFLPWVGNLDQENVAYREALLEKTIVLIMKNPFFGSRHFILDSEMQDLALGSGFVDIVNTYARVAMSNGLLGLVFFIGCLFTVITGVFTTMRGSKNKNDEIYRLGQILLSALISIAFMISTVSSVTVIPLIYWSVIGMGVGYILMARHLHKQDIIIESHGNSMLQPSQKRN